MLGGMASEIPMMLYPGQADKLPTRAEMVEKIPSLGSYHLAANDSIDLDLYAYPGVRARFSLRQTRIERANVAFANLPAATQEGLLEAAMKAIAELAKAGRPTAAPGGVKSNDPPPPGAERP
ncbi:MAG: hypothetical protein ACO1SV_19035 [Fimbriimonas sp.]